MASGQQPSAPESHRRKNKSVIYTGLKVEKKSRDKKARNAYYNEAVGKVRHGAGSVPKRQLLDSNLYQL